MTQMKSDQQLLFITKDADVIQTSLALGEECFCILFFILKNISGTVYDWLQAAS